MKITRDIAKKQAWLREYEKLLTERYPELKGRIDWSIAYYHYATQKTPKDAVEKFKVT